MRIAGRFLKKKLLLWWVFIDKEWVLSLLGQWSSSVHPWLCLYFFQNYVLKNLGESYHFIFTPFHCTITSWVFPLKLLGLRLRWCAWCLMNILVLLNNQHFLKNALDYTNPLTCNCIFSLCVRRNFALLSLPPFIEVTWLLLNWNLSFL